jgi:hypothetical protein
VRRLLSLLLLAVFSLPLLLPALALAQGPESNLPACCRRNGAHHCSMSEQEMTALLNGTRASAPRPHCPNYPVAITALRHVDLATPKAAPALASVVGQSALLFPSDTRTRLTLDNTHLTRGPPASALL